jgi:hypothetical protein
MFLSVACPELQYFSTLSHTRQNSLKKVAWRISNFSKLLSKTFLIQRRTESHYQKRVLVFI